MEGFSPLVRGSGGHDSRGVLLWRRCRSDWAVKYCPDAGLMNVGSDAQKAHLLFAPCDRIVGKKGSGSYSGAGQDVVLGTPDTYASDATRWPASRVFQVSVLCVLEGG